MDGLRQAIPVSLDLTLNGVTYKIPPWDFGDFTKIEARLAKNKPTLREKAEALAVLDVSLQEKMFKQLVLDHERESRVSHAEVFSYMTTDMEGMSYAVWIAFDRENPNVFTFDEFRAAIVKEASKDPEKISKLVDEIREASGVPPTMRPTEAGEAPPKMTPQERRKLRESRAKEAKKRSSKK